MPAHRRPGAQFCRVSVVQWEIWAQATEGNGFTITMNGNDATIEVGLGQALSYGHWTITSTTPSVESVDMVIYNGTLNNIDVMISDQTAMNWDELKVLDLEPGCKNFDGVAGTGADNVSIIAVVTDDITDLSGTLDLNSVGKLQAGGDIDANIVSNAYDNRKLVLVQAGGAIDGSIQMVSSNTEVTKIEAGGVLRATIDAGDNLKNVQAASIDGNISADGSVGRIETTAGGIGVTGPVTISCEGFLTGATSGIFAADDCEASITVNTNLTPDIVIDGDLVGMIDIDGDLLGDLTMHGSVIDGGVFVFGALSSGSAITIDDDVRSSTVQIVNDIKDNAALTIGDELKNGSGVLVNNAMQGTASISIGSPTTVTAIDASSWIEIGGDVATNAVVAIDGDMNGMIDLRDLLGTLSVSENVGTTGVITMDTLDSAGAVADVLIKDDLAGQIIINQHDNNDQWLGTVSVNTYGIDPNEIVCERAPYYCLLSDDLGGGAVGLIPYNLHAADCVPEPGIPTESFGAVTLAHYGPVNDDSASGMPVEVWKKPILSYPPQGYTEVTSDFEAEILANDRLIEVSPKPFTSGFECGYYYKILPTDDLHCGGTAALAAADVDVDDYTYLIKKYCKADLSRNGLVDTPDPVLWVAGPVDINEDGLVDVADLNEIFDEME